MNLQLCDAVVASNWTFREFHILNTTVRNQRQTTEHNALADQKIVIARAKCHRANLTVNNRQRPDHHDDNNRESDPPPLRNENRERDSAGEQRQERQNRRDDADLGKLGRYGVELHIGWAHRIEHRWSFRVSFICVLEVLSCHMRRSLISAE